MPKKNNSVKKTTQCVLCGTLIEYTSRKPSRCAKCNKIKLEQQGCARTSWTKESQMIKIMHELLPYEEYIVNGYYSWLVSPKGMPLQLDWYCPSLSLAIEVNGLQHTTFVKHFTKTKRDFNYLKECDALKVSACKAKGITLLVIPYDKVLSKSYFLEEIRAANPELYKRIGGV